MKSLISKHGSRQDPVCTQSSAVTPERRILPLIGGSRAKAFADSRPTRRTSAATIAEGNCLVSARDDRDTVPVGSEVATPAAAESSLQMSAIRAAHALLKQVFAWEGSACRFSNARWFWKVRFGGDFECSSAGKRRSRRS